MVKKTTSLKIDAEIWKQVKKTCIDKDQEISNYVEELIANDLGIKRKH